MMYVAHWRPIACFALTLAILLATSDPACAGEKAKSRKAKAAPRQAPLAVADPTLPLLRDAAVQRELKLTPEQANGIDQALVPVDLPLFQLRDHTSDEAAARRRELVRQFRDRAIASLDQDQQRRFSQLVIQAQGWPAVLLEEHARALKLTDSQYNRIRDVIVETREKAAAHEKNGASQPADQQQAGLRKLRESERDRILALFDKRQREQVIEMAGDTFDFSQVKQTAGRAPELAGLSAWMNGSPRTLESLKGKVVALHFFAFG